MVTWGTREYYGAIAVTRSGVAVFVFGIIALLTTAVLKFSGKEEKKT